MTFFIPKPLRDVVSLGAHERRFQTEISTELTASQAKINFWIGKIGSFFPHERVARAAIRIALAASAAFLLSAASIKTILLAAVVGSVISLPTVMIASGGYLLCQGVISLVTAIASVHFSTIALALANCAVGWFALECYDMAPFLANI
jgi:hypothetical protein